jgi:hypothetical protein
MIYYRVLNAVGATMATTVFISYRREDSAAYAGRIKDWLVREFGRDFLFIDVEGIPLGINFVKALRDEVAKCGVLLAVIGPHWLDVRNEDGTRRLDNPNDFVRIEIAVALQRNIPVIPILLDGTRVPKIDQLPKNLQELSLRNGLNVRHDSFPNDMDRLILGLKKQRLSPAPALPPGYDMPAASPFVSTPSPTTVHFLVRVLDRDGEPLAGVQVEILIHGFLKGGHLSQYTDSDGYASFEREADYEDSSELTIYVRGQSFGKYVIEAGTAYTITLE